MKIFLILICISLISCGKDSITIESDNSVSAPVTPVTISNISGITSSLRANRWTVLEVEGVPELTAISGSSTDGLMFSGSKRRLNLKSLTTTGSLTGSLEAMLNGSTDSASFDLTVLPAYPEIRIDQFSLNSTNIYDITGVVENSSFLGDPTQYKIVSCLHIDIYYCQNLSVLDSSGNFSKSAHNFYGGFPSGDRVQFVLVHNSIAAADLSGVIDRYSETNTSHHVWREMDGINVINFKNHHLTLSVAHPDPQIQNLLSRFGKYEQTAGVPSPANPARFVRSYLDTDQFYLYDQALAVFAFTRASEQGAAKKVLNALKNQWTAHGSNGWFYFSYNSDNTGSIYPVEGDRRLSGSISWVSMAVSYYKSIYQSDTDYDVMAKSVIEYLRSQTIAINVRGVAAKAVRFGGSDFAGTTWDETDVASLEHNLDFHSALVSYVNSFPSDLDNSAYSTLRTEIRSFIDSLWSSGLKRFSPGAYFSTNLTNTVDINLDTQSWTVLALGANYKEGVKTNCELFIETAGYIQGGNAGIVGFYDSRPSATAPSYKFVWSEGTAGQALAMKRIEDETGEVIKCQGLGRSDFLSSLQSMTDSTGGVAYSTSTTSNSFTTSSSVGGTAWLYFARTGFNPFAY